LKKIIGMNLLMHLITVLVVLATTIPAFASGSLINATGNPAYQAELKPAKIHVIPETESYIEISGKAVPFNYRCETNVVSAMVPSSLLYASIHNVASPDIEVVIPVNQFQCGIRRLNQDFRNALKADRFPDITFNMYHIKEVNANKQEFKLTGMLNVAGTERNVEIFVTVIPVNNNQIRITGEKDLSMSRFNIDPPTPVPGLVRVEDEMTIKFNLVYDQNHVFH
jgi:hypothetical protein